MHNYNTESRHCILCSYLTYSNSIYLLDIQSDSYRQAVSLVYTSHVPAERLHPFKGFTAVIADKLFPLSVDGLVSVQSAGGDKSLPAYFTDVRPLSRVCPDMSCEVGAVTEALLAHRAAIRLVFALLVVVIVVVLVVVVEG